MVILERSTISLNLQIVQSTDVGRAWDFHEIRPASSSPRSFHFPLDGIIVVDLKPFKETSSMRVCPFVWVCVCLCTCCWAQLAFCRDIMATRLRDCCGIFTKDVNFFFFSKHLNQRRLFFLKTRRLLVQRLFSVLQFCLVWVLFVHSLMYFCLCAFELDQSGLDLGCARHYSQHSTYWMYCCKYIVTHSYAVTVDSLHMYY